MKREGVSRFFSFLKKKAPVEEFPLLPLRELVLFPQTIIPMFVTHKGSLVSVETALGRDRRLFAVCLAPSKEGRAHSRDAGGKKSPDGTQSAPQDPFGKPSFSNAAEEAVTAPPWDDYGDLAPVGTVVRIIHHLKLPDNTYRLVLQGEYRATVRQRVEEGDLSLVSISPISPEGAEGPQDSQITALMRTVQKSFAQYGEYTKKISVETLTAVEKTESPERLGNLIGNALSIKAERKLDLLGIADSRERLEKILETLEMENEILGIQKNINGKVKSRMERSQREYFLHEQLKEINKELGKTEGETDEFADLEKAIEARNPPEEVLKKARKELARLRKLQPLSPEAGVLRGYLEWIGDLPWSECSVDSGDLPAAEMILNEDHFDMHKAKERILEFIAVRELTSRESERSGAKGPILCFVGPPGTGKTSLGKSVARSLGRNFIRISLGGVRDEAEIRGHRKTYVGALPGKIIQSMRKAETVNPVFLLDEIDKMSSDFRGDPAAALLEALDPEQNVNFTDHYLEVPYDLSKVFFIATANSLYNIPYPLLDRMEIIEIPGYGEMEKLSIAQQFLIPKTIRENGLSSAKISFQDDAILEIERYWTMESGVRGLEREIARCVRRIAREAVEQNYGQDPEKPLEDFQREARREDLEKLLGRRKYKNDVVYQEARIGVTYGLAWTETGGTMLPVETARFDGNGDLLITGNLGEVMKESARIALSYLRSAQERYNFSAFDIGKGDFHLHVPEGAIPKDGPSAGITLAASLLSTLCGLAPRPAIAMTGELTLTGRVLPIGGLKEKVLAAIRNGMRRVLIPGDNREDWRELDDEIKNAIDVAFIDTADEAFNLLFDERILRKPESQENP